MLSTYKGREQIGWRGHEWEVQFSHCTLFCIFDLAACICLNNYNTILYQDEEKKRMIIKNKEQRKKEPESVLRQWFNHAIIWLYIPSGVYSK